jgi:hypothetical protein
MIVLERGLDLLEILREAAARLADGAGAAGRKHAVVTLSASFALTRARFCCRT